MLAEVIEKENAGAPVKVARLTIHVAVTFKSWGHKRA